MESSNVNHLRELAIEGLTRGDSIGQVASVLWSVNEKYKYGLTRDAVADILAAFSPAELKKMRASAQISPKIEINIHEPENASDAPATASSASLWDRLGLVLSKSDIPLTNIDNLIKIFVQVPEFKDFVWFDEFHQKYFTKWRSSTRREWSDVDDLNLTLVLQRNIRMGRLSDDIAHRAVVVYAHQHTKNEPKDWLESLTWDGLERIEGFLGGCLGAEGNLYTLAASKNFWIALAARIYEPGCQVDNMLVLEGPQGIGKTQALRCVGGPWYAEAQEAVTDKDFFMTLQGKVIVEIAELDSFGKAEVARIKQVITCRTDRYRAPYARSAQDFPRRCVFVGTTNESSYLRDNTGGRRFWPVRCGKIDLRILEKEREQFFAEAAHKFKAGADWYEMPGEITSSEQEARRQPDVWEDAIEEALSGRDTITMIEVGENVLKLDLAHMDMTAQRRIGSILRRLNWHKKDVKSENKVRKIWYRNGSISELPLV